MSNTNLQKATTKKSRCEHEKPLLLKIIEKILITSCPGTIPMIFKNPDASLTIAEQSVLTFFGFKRWKLTIISHVKSNVRFEEF